MKQFMSCNKTNADIFILAFVSKISHFSGWEYVSIGADVKDSLSYLKVFCIHLNTETFDYFQAICEELWLCLKNFHEFSIVDGWY